MGEGVTGEPNSLNDRVERLEEAQMFAERRMDLLSEQMTALEQKLREVGDRLRRIEENVGRIDERLSTPEDPDTDLP
jgi:uncharacterized coiled-coil protein SlyX